MSASKGQVNFMLIAKKMMKRRGSTLALLTGSQLINQTNPKAMILDPHWSSKTPLATSE
jgi:hypothetical protein